MAVQLDRIYIGADGSDFVAISDPSAASSYFQSALDDHVPAGGGFELHVTPGSSSYVFDAEVVVDRPDVSLHFSPGAQLRLSGTTAQNMFLVRAPGFRCSGARVVHSITAGNDVAGRSLFRIDDSGQPNSTDGAGFENCVFHVDQQFDAIESFSCIRSEGASAASPRRGLDVVGCTFFLAAEGVAQAVAWGPSGPFGLCAIRGTHTRSSILSRNLFRGIDARGSHCGPMVYLEGCPDAVVTVNAFRHLDVLASGSGTEQGSLIRVASSSGQEGHHTVLASNVFENVRAQHVIELLDARGDVVAFSNFGRVLKSDAALRCGAAQDGSRGEALGVVGNNFHNIKRSDREIVRLEAIADVTVSGNVLVLFDEDERPFSFEPGSCENVHVAPGQTWGRL